MKIQVTKEIESIALTCILSVLCAVSLTKLDIQTHLAVIYWLIFVVSCGLVIDYEKIETIERLILLSFFPSLILILSMLFIGYLYNISYPDLYVFGSGGRGLPANEANALRIVLLYFMIFIFTIPGIIISSLARGLIVRNFWLLIHVNSGDLVDLKKKISILRDIFVLIIGAFIAFGVTVSPTNSPSKNEELTNYEQHDPK